MVSDKVTIVVVPRERFSVTQRSLENIYQETDCPLALTYIDGGSPKSVKEYLLNQSRERHFQLIRTDHYLTPNEARNLGIRHAQSEYIVFIDNDVLVKRGWLEALVNCADETGAWVVGPLYLIGDFDREIVHMAAGNAHIVNREGRRRFFETQRFGGKHLTEVKSQLRREPCEMVEFHCTLVRKEIFEKIGVFDEGLKSALENPDFSMSVRQAGGQVYFEPSSVVTYLPPDAQPLTWSDIPYFALRWSYTWNYSTLAHFREKWCLPQDDPTLTHQFATWEGWRRNALLGPVEKFRSFFGRRLGTFVHNTLSRLEEKISAAVVGDRRRSSPTDGERGF